MNKDTIEAYDLAYGAGTLLEMSDGTELYCEVRGPADRPALVIVNNYFIICPLWRNFTSQLAERFRVITYDLRNQGVSTRITGELHFATHVRDLEALLLALRIHRTYLMGTSISSLICRDFALAHADRVSGMALFGPVFNPFGDRRRKLLTRSWLRSLELGGPRALFDHIYPLVYSDRAIEAGGSATYLALRERFLALNSHEQLDVNLRASLTTTDDPQLLRQLACPTLLAAGDADFLWSESSLRAAAALMPDGRAAVIPMAGHVPYFEATSSFEALVAEFIDDVEVTRATAGGTERHPVTGTLTSRSEVTIDG